jgi:hypothetical protein
VGLSGDGTTAFLGAFGVNDYTGAVEVFSSPSEAWTSTSTPVATLSDASGQSGDVFGAIVFPSVDGATVAVAAPGAPGDFDIGAGYVFHAADETSWTSTSTPTATLTDSSRVEGDVLGGSLSFSGDGATVVLGAPGVNDYIGAADVFHASDASSWATASTPNATLTNAALLQSLCIVPALKGLTLRGAKQALVAAGCRGGTVTTAYSSVIPAGRVVLQKTKPGVHLPLGTKVAFKLSLGPFHRH